MVNCNLPKGSPLFGRSSRRAQVGLLRVGGRWRSHGEDLFPVGEVEWELHSRTPAAGPGSLQSSKKCVVSSVEGVSIDSEWKENAA